MRVHRGYLFWGVFFVLLGAIPMADRLGWIDADQIADVGRLWPLVIIAIGLAIVLSRSRLAVLATVAAAAVLGVIAGSALAWSSSWMFGLGDCAPGNGDLQQTSRSGTFSGPAQVQLVSSCGDTAVTVAPGADWTIAAGHRGGPPTVASSATSLSLRSSDGSGRQEWAVSLPTAMLGSLAVTSNAGQTTIDVNDAAMSGLDLELNAGEALVTASGTSIADLDIGVNAGRARITLGGPVAGSIEVNAGSIELCVPADAALSFDVGDQFAFDTNLASRGLAQEGDRWVRAGSGGPVIELAIDGNAASLQLDPTGGCG